MDRRSTSAEYTHYGGDVTGQVNSSHGVRLSGGSTGGIVEAVGDDTNVTLVIRAQGAGGIVLGNSSQGLGIRGPSTLTGAVTVAGAAAFSGSSFSIAGASSIALSPTSTAGITIGNSSNQNPILITGSSIAFTSTHVNINSSRTVIGASTTPIILFQRSRIDFTVPAISSNAADNSVEVAVTGLTTNAICFIQQRQIYNSTVTAGLHVEGYCSTAGALRLNIYNLSVSSVSGSTMSADLFRLEVPVAV